MKEGEEGEEGVEKREEKTLHLLPFVPPLLLSGNSVGTERDMKHSWEEGEEGQRKEKEVQPSLWLHFHSSYADDNLGEESLLHRFWQRRDGRQEQHAEVNLLLGRKNRRAGC